MSRGSTAIAGNEHWNGMHDVLATCQQLSGPEELLALDEIACGDTHKI